VQPFRQWALEQGWDDAAEDYPPRALIGDYLEHAWSQVVAALPGGTRVRVLRGTRAPGRLGDPRRGPWPAAPRHTGRARAGRSPLRAAQARSAPPTRAAPVPRPAAAERRGRAPGIPRGGARRCADLHRRGAEPERGTRRSLRGASRRPAARISARTPSCSAPAGAESGSGLASSSAPPAAVRSSTPRTCRRCWGPCSARRSGSCCASGTRTAGAESGSGLASSSAPLRPVGRMTAGSRPLGR
jgi:hypothetical protein